MEIKKGHVPHTNKGESDINKPIIITTKTEVNARMPSKFTVILILNKYQQAIRLDK